MKSDPIVAEVRKVREAHAMRHGNDLRRIYADLKKAEARDHWPQAQVRGRTSVRACVAEDNAQYLAKKGRSATKHALSDTGGA